jgi:PPOX class probable F420-dependent enzyme
MDQASLDLAQPKHAHADERLRKDFIIWFGTVRPDGRPHMVPVWFLWDGASLLVFSKPDQKIRNLKNDPRVMLALDDTDRGEDVILIEGEAALLEPGDLDTTLPAYAEKYAAKFEQHKWTAEQMAEEYTQAIRITPTRFMVA